MGSGREKEGVVYGRECWKASLNKKMVVWAGGRKGRLVGGIHKGLVERAGGGERAGSGRELGKLV